MAVLIAGLLLFLGMHSTRVLAEGWRADRIDRPATLPPRFRAAASQAAPSPFPAAMYTQRLKSSVSRTRRTPRN